MRRTQPHTPRTPITRRPDRQSTPTQTPEEPFYSSENDMRTIKKSARIEHGNRRPSPLPANNPGGRRGLGPMSLEERFQNMTGNTKVWRAPLAGLAAVAMLATMGVAASTANAAAPGTVDVTIEGNSAVTVTKGDTLADALALAGRTLTPSGSGYFVGWYDVNNTAAPFDFNAPVTKDVKLKPVYKDGADKITLNFVNASGVAYKFADSSAQTTTDPSYGSASTIYVDKNASTEIPATRVPGVAAGTVAGDSASVPTSWDFNDGAKATTQTAADLTSKGYPFNTTPTAPVNLTLNGVSKAAKVSFLNPGANLLVVGAASDGQPAGNQFDALVAKDAAVVKAPTVIDTTGAKVYKQWKNDRTGIKYAFGTEITPSDVQPGDTFSLDTSATSVTKQYTVSFDLNGGNGEIDDQTVAENGVAVKPADPTKDGYVFQGWKAVKADNNDLGALNAADGFYAFDSEVKGDLTLQAQWAKTADIKVTFSAGKFAGAGDDKTVTVKGDAFVDESQAPAFKRDGYTIDHWGVDKNGDGVADSADPFDFDATLAGKVNGGKNFTLVAVWERVDENQAKKALNYVTLGTDDLKDSNHVTDNADDSGYFTDASWNEFVKAYKAQYQKYVAAKYVNGSTNTNEVSSTVSAEIVNSLKDAWKGLRFSAEYADTTLDGVANLSSNGHDNTAKVIYRLAKGSAQHLLTGDEVEIKALTKTNSNAAGWTLDATTFRTVNNFVSTEQNGKLVSFVAHPEWVAGTDQNAKDFYGFAPLLTEVSRLYNGREHLYTSDAVEIGALLERGWSKDSNLASFYVPAQYTTGTHIVRLYNPASGTHLYTSDAVEIGHLLARGWTQDSDNAGFYAL
ncbi:hypothetical protein COO72_12385 [Bifidobacterium callitrichos]|nr:hypothetical protein COO72_12385 [Bifidobacterium callitrichos]